jgi:LysR family transcriptional activator of glutamate synthase operon
MELLQLKYFQMLARVQNVTKVANELNVAQPSLSIMLSRLEKNLGVKLFDRKGRKLVLNKYGKAFLKRVDRILNELNFAKDEIDKIRGNEKNEIILATTGTTFLSGLISNFLNKNPNVKIKQFVTSANEARDLLKSSEIDFAITSPPISDEDIETTVIVEDEILLAVPLDHKLASEDSVDLLDLKDEHFIDLIGHYNFRKITDKMCELAGFTPNIVFEGEIPLMAELLKSGQGIALIPKSLSNFYPNFPAKAIRIRKPDYKRVIALSFSLRKYQTEAFIKFKNFTEKYFKVI